MEFKKKLLLPKTGISQEYYKQQLWLHNFCIHDNVSHRAKMFLFAEHYAGKGPNEVISCLKYYLSTIRQQYASYTYSQITVSHGTRTATSWHT